MGAYLDHAATAPVLPEAAEAFAHAAAELGNPSAVHAFGRTTRRIVEESREESAAVLGADPAEVILTSGGTEADNLAVLGRWEALAGEGPEVAGRRLGVVVSAIEHPAVLESAHHLAQRRGAGLHLAPVTADGVLDLDAPADPPAQAERAAGGIAGAPPSRATY